MSSLPKEAVKRAEARSDWVIRRYRLGSEPSENLSASTTASERLSMMWELAEQAWSLAGEELPDYPRHRIPGRVIRRSR